MSKVISKTEARRLARAKIAERRKAREEAERRALEEAQRRRLEADQANESDLIDFVKAQQQKATAKQRYEDDLRAADVGMAEPLRRIVERVGSVSEAAALADISASSARSLLRRVNDEQAADAEQSAGGDGGTSDPAPSDTAQTYDAG